MGQYEPDDSRDVTNSSQSAPGEPQRTGPREGESRQQQQGDAPGKAQAGYGNSRDNDGTMEQDANSDTKTAKAADADEVVGETSADPARQAEADAKRPLGGA